MSDTVAAILILPVLAALVIALECGRIGCSRLFRRLCEPESAKLPLASRSQV